MNSETELPFDYHIVRSRKRRTASLMIDKGRVEVRVPALADECWIDNWVRSKVDWVLPRLQRQTRALEQRAIEISQGGRFFVNGRELALSWRRASRSGVVMADQEIQVSISARVRRPESEVVHEQLQQWMAQQAEAILVPLCLQLGREMRLVPSTVRIKNYRRKWGQCDSRGVITLNWRILHLDPALQRYILVHELCHLKEMNHSSAFWRLVSLHCPEYATLRRQLTETYPYLIW
ncbi:M48 family metallopeptidase [Marinobacterium lutimaris]|uniref:YgjP-like metallopeptidase domain-containing protein n=1 Tax=Marinobacterium lutimaris TaxID=568106 RepID=A0A1H5UAH8_9GAMM|nr:SprT family zinc-dependent metalloprotease [Marinobacterium lutimaris]SEF71331.1 hypothetical protein SAMN05444390_101301 [Marinobacterium lutimaris]